MDFAYFMIGSERVCVLQTVLRDFLKILALQYLLRGNIWALCNSVDVAHDICVGSQ